MSAADIADTHRRLKRERRALMRVVCSGTWFDDNWYGVQMLVRGVCRKVAAPHPPGGDRTLMQACNVCGRMTPPNYLSSSGGCEDCKMAGWSQERLNNTPGSISVVSIRHMRACNARGQQYLGEV